MNKAIPLLAVAALALPVQAAFAHPYPYVQAFVGNEVGATFGIKGGEELLWKFDYTFATNLGGGSAAVGFPYKTTKIYFGLSVLNVDDKDGSVNVAGEQVQARSDSTDGTGIFTEVQFDNGFFTRLTLYSTKYHFQGSRTFKQCSRFQKPRCQEVTASNGMYESETGALVWLGYTHTFE